MESVMIVGGLFTDMPYLCMRNILHLYPYNGWLLNLVLIAVC